MEVVGFIVVFLVCMGIAKAINAVRGRLSVNGAAMFLWLATAFIVWNLYMAWQSSLPSYELGYALGRSIVPVILVSIVAIYYFVKFRSEKAHQDNLKKLREWRTTDES